MARQVKIGDLVRCTWQPRCAGIVNGYATPMEYVIKGQAGILISIRGDGHSGDVMFTQLAGYVHPLALSTFDVINEDR